MSNIDFGCCHRLANDYFYRYCESKRSLTHKLSNRHFILWIYFIHDDKFNAEDELKIVKDLSDDHDLKNKSWKKIPDVFVYKASQYEAFDKVAAFVFSPK